MQPRFFAGVDGGATGTRARLAGADGRVLGDGEAGPSSLTLGVEAAWTSIRAALGAAGATDEMLRETVLACGLAGTGSPANRTRFFETAPPVARLLLCSDGHATVLGAHGGAPGAAVAIGTGTVGNVLREDGSTAQVGGWGFPIGDEGSGAWIGRAALAEALAVLDGRAVDPPGGTGLHRALLDLCGPSPSALLAWLYPAPSTKYASLAPVVVGYAQQGDPAARRILAGAAAEIARMIEALDPAARLPLALGGGLAPVIGPMLAPDIRARLRPAMGDARDGALALARHGGPLEQFWE